MPRLDVRTGGDVCQEAGREGKGDWRLTQNSFKKGVKIWLAKEKKPDEMLKEAEDRMLTLNSKQLNQRLREEERQIQHEHTKILLMREQYWYQRARTQQAMFGDNNTSDFHASAVQRKRRNTVRAIQKKSGEWETEDKRIREEFRYHFLEIYQSNVTARVFDVFSEQILQELPTIDPIWEAYLISDPIEEEIYRTLMSPGPDKAPGPDGFNACLLQINWAYFKQAIVSEVKEFFQTGRMKSTVARSNLVLIPKKQDASL